MIEKYEYFKGGVCAFCSLCIKKKNLSQENFWEIGDGMPQCLYVYSIFDGVVPHGLCFSCSVHLVIVVGQEEIGRLDEDLSLCIQPVLDTEKHYFSHYVSSRYSAYCFSLSKSSSQPYSWYWKLVDLCSPKISWEMSEILWEQCSNN